MRLNRLPKMADRLVCACTLSFAVLFVTPAFSASKAKPDLPIGEEIEPSTPASRTSEKPATSPAAQKKSEKEAHSGAASTKNPEKEAHSSAPAGTKGLAEKELEESKAQSQGEEKDPYAQPPAAHGEEKKPHSPADAMGDHAGQNHDSSKKSDSETLSTPAAKPKLLEGKVDPATPAQGKGLIWFAVVFVLLSIAIFIFT